ncbi:MAG: aryl-sulfate sulfotransferase, partial [Spirochaetota bacterium]
MAYARTRIKGLVYCDSRRASGGLTLFTPLEGKGVWLIDMQGRVINQWEMPYKPGCYGELLPNGNMLYAGRNESGPLSDVEGAGGVLLETDWSGRIVWEYTDPYLHHGFYRMKNGNTLVMKWTEVPEHFAGRVRGGDPGSEKNGIMWGEKIQEIRPSGTVAWEWMAHEHLAPEDFARCPFCPRDTWLHGNGCVELPDGSILVSFAKVNTIAIIDKNTGNVKWSWGTDGELAHQHSPVYLHSGNVLVFDNGFHPNGMAQNYSRVLEIDPRSNKMVWSYEGPESGDMRMLIYSSMYSNCQRLSNGNTLIC